MKRRTFLTSSGIGLATLAGAVASGHGRLRAGIPGQAESGGGRPNFILINVDDLGWTDLSCYGSGYYETPRIDRLAGGGVKFTNGYAACAVCSPTRASILTGRAPARIGLTDWIRHLDRSSFLALGLDRNPRDYVPEEGRRLLCPPNPFWMELEEVTLAEVLRESGYATGHVGKWHLGFADWYPEKQGFDVNVGGCETGQPPSYFDPYYQNAARSSIPTLRPRKQGEYLIDREADEAVGFLRSHAGKPFFLNWWPYAVHTPLEAKPELVAKYEAKRKTSQKNPVYAAMIESLDGAVGRLLDALDELGLAERTVVLFTSDNGGLKDVSTDNAPLRSGKGYPYEGGIRVPLIVSWPGRIRPGSMSGVPAASFDIFPTFCELAGAALPAGRPIDGLSLVPLLTGAGPIARDELFWHFPHYRGRDVVPYSIIRKGDWKLIKRYEGRPFELFNLREDPGEARDLAERDPDRVRQLDGRLALWLAEVGARLPRPNPDSRPLAAARKKP